MYIRLNVTTLDQNSRRPQGIIHAAYALRESEDIMQHEREILQNLIDWFNEYLAIPPKSVRDRLDASAVFWFKRTNENACILEKAWELAFLLQLHDYEVNVWRAINLPGIVVWEDEMQAATAALRRKQGRETWVSRPLVKDRTP